MELDGKPAEHVKVEDPDDEKAEAIVKSDQSRGKTARIVDACKWKDIETLRALAVSDAGLISDELRRQACQSFPYHINQRQLY